MLTKRWLAVEDVEVIVHAGCQQQVRMAWMPLQPPHSSTHRTLTEGLLHVAAIPEQNLLIIAASRSRTCKAWEGWKGCISSGSEFYTELYWYLWFYTFLTGICHWTVTYLKNKHLKHLSTCLTQSHFLDLLSLEGGKRSEKTLSVVPISYAAGSMSFIREQLW